MKTPTRLVVLALVGSYVLAATSAHADDFADEADLQFRIGTEAYAARNYRGAIEHFLASNRLVPNRNVVFNIARSFEQLAQYADAHRYYSLAFDLEHDSARRTQIRDALVRIQPFVTVLRIVTDPPGATLFINRRDLGPRGRAPRDLAFPAGTYRVMAELDGYEPAQSEEVQADNGKEIQVTLRLKQILGSVRVEGQPGAEVRVDRADGPLGCRIPCTLPAPPGSRRLWVSWDGYATSEVRVDVVANQTVSVNTELAPLTGALVIDTEDTAESGALVEVDGRPVGFTPLVANVPVGQRQVRVSLSGFRTIERTVTIHPNEQTRLPTELRQLEQVEAASRTLESVDDAPSSVTIIPRQEIVGMGYPSIIEALRGTRGVFVSDDRFYPTAGFRGFSRMGDYNNRMLVLLNGQPTNDNWGFFNFLGYDARVDLEDVERIEVIRGPGSVLYGTGAVSGIVNVVTRGRDTKQGVDAQISTVERNISRARVSGALRYGKTSGAWASASIATSPGRDFYFPELARSADATTGDPGSDGHATGADDMRAYTTQGRAWAGPISAQWLYSSRKKSIPPGIGGSSVGDEANNNTDSHGLFELRFEPRISSKAQLMSRIGLTHYEFAGSYTYDPSDGTTPFARERFVGNWVTTEGRLTWSPWASVRLMTGAEAQFHLQADQRGEAWAEGCGRENAGDCAHALYLPVSDQYSPDVFEKHPFQIVAGYALADVTPISALHISAGVRYDRYLFADRGFGALSPRLAFVARPYEQGNLKVMGSRAFRAPSVYEQYYNDGFESFAPSTYAPQGKEASALTPETMWSGEFEFSHRFGSAWKAILAGFTNYYENFIVTGEVPSPPDPETGESVSLAQFQNSSAAPVLTLGGELELRREWRQGWMLGVSYSYQQTRYMEKAGVDELREVPNSPEHLAAAHGAMPVIGRLLVLNTRLSYEGPRWDRNEFNAQAETQGHVDGGLVWDLVLSGQEQRAGLRYSVGFYNLLDWQYDVPVGAFMNARTVRQNGRSLIASLGAGF